ncbi:MAG: hypothetical protein ACHRXM_26825 [Isosphaerales bacterium]
MAQVEGNVEVYESSDGGTGDPGKTVWQFFIGKQPTVTKNREIAATMRLAIQSAHKVMVTRTVPLTTPFHRLVLRSSERGVPIPKSIEDRLTSRCSGPAFPKRDHGRVLS